MIAEASWAQGKTVRNAPVAAGRAGCIMPASAFSKEGILKPGLAHMARAAVIALAAATSAPDAQAQDAERKPKLAYSIAELPAGSKAGGPLFERAKAALAAADKGGSAAFGRFLAPGATLKLNVFEPASGELRQADFTAATVRAASRACLGPFPFDETASWVQLSWVCRVDAQSPLAPYIAFRDNPELTLTIWYEKGLIRVINARESLMIPMRPRLTMDAYEILKSRR